MTELSVAGLTHTGNPLWCARGERVAEGERKEHHYVRGLQTDGLLCLWGATHISIFLIVRDDCKDDQVQSVDKEVEEKESTCKHPPLLVQQMTQRLLLQHLVTVLRGETHELLLGFCAEEEQQLIMLWTHRDATAIHQYFKD